MTDFLRLISIKTCFCVFLLLITGLAYAQNTEGLEVRAQQELDERGIDQEELRTRLLEKGVDLDRLSALSQQEALKAQRVIESTIQEMEAEKADTIPRRDITPSVKSEKSFDTRPIKDTTKSVDTILKTPEVPFEEVEIYGQHIFRDQNLKVYDRSQDIKPPSSYVLGSGDEIIVSIWGLSRLDEKMTINDRGFVSPYKMPRVFLKGFTYQQAREILADRYAEYYRFRKNEFEVVINYTRSIEISIFGEVQNYGGFTLPATNTAFNALVAAGGPSDIGSVRRIKLRREDEVKIIDVYDYMNDPSIAASYYLRDNDIIQVPVAENVVVIDGEVNRPFKYELLEGETLEDVIRFAGGFSTSALTSRIRITRFEGKERVSIDVDYNLADSNGRFFELRHGDRIKVDRVDVEENNVIFVTGEVDYPGEYARNPGLMLSDLLDKAGLKPTSRTDLAFLKRNNGDGTVNLKRISITEILEDDSRDIELQNGDELIVYARSRYVDSTYFEVDGAVREPGRFLFDKSGGITLYDAILLSGGLRADAQDYGYVYRKDGSGGSDLQYIRVNVGEVTKSDAARDNISLRSGDRIVIGSAKVISDEKYIDIIGAVKRPGRYEYGKDMTLKDVLSLAGGFTFSAASNRIDLFRVEIKDNQATKTVITTLDVSRDLNEISSGGNTTLQPFDQVVVREVPEFEFQQNVRVEGEVRYPGPYALTTDNERLVSVIERAGNLTVEAFPEGATLFRKMDSIGYVVIDLKEAMEDLKSRFNIFLKDGDIIQVPKQQDLVRIIGFTNASELYPDRILSEQNGISVPYYSGKNARYYIDEFAAGVASDGNANDITVEHANGQIERAKNYGIFRSYPKVRPGSIIRVGKKPVREKRERGQSSDEEVNWGKVFANSIAQATTILSLILLLQRID